MQRKITKYRVINFFICTISGLLLFFLSSGVCGQIAISQPDDNTAKKAAAIYEASYNAGEIIFSDDQKDDYFNLGGTVFADIYPLDFICATLYSNDGLHIFDVYHNVFDTLGYYYFMNLIPAPYLVKAEPDHHSSQSGMYVPTYMGDVLFWQEAYFLDLDENIYQANIHLIHSVGYGPGSGNISGTVVFSEKEGNKDKIPAPNIEILLFNLSGEPLSYHNSDYLGQFNFNNLAFGTYLVYPELAGKQSLPFLATLDAAHPNISLWISITKNNIAAGDGPDIEAPGNIFSDVYPIPSINQVNIDYQITNDQSCKLSILGMAGNTIRDPEVYNLSGQNTISIDVNDLAAGTYFIRIENENGLFAVRKFIKMH
jgi:hypothetical protein